MSLKHLALAALLATGAATASADTTTCTAGVNNCAEATDGFVPAQMNPWFDRTAFWEGTAEAVTLQLSQPARIGQLFLAVDNNDDYLVEGSLDGNLWFTLGSVASSAGAVPVAPGGIDWFTTVPGSPFTLGSLQFAPTDAAWLRVRATDGDGRYSVGELLYTAAPVPEPGSWALMLAGAAGLVLRRRRA